jgi:C-3',4' desaturase CrtD
MNIRQNHFDAVIIGAGMGGMTAASLLANDGHRVLILEAAHVPGGCSSSYYRKGYTFESGATTLIGFDENQPLKKLEGTLGITIRKKPIEPSMQVHMDGEIITRYRDRDRWVEEAIRVFGQPFEQKQFWEKAYEVSDIVWKVSGKNHFFPPLEAKDWLSLLKNHPKDALVLPYAATSVMETARQCGITNPDFFRFLDEQLLISAQSKSGDTPFLFGAPSITYTNYTNYYVPGGLVEMVKQLQQFVENRGGFLNVKEKVLGISGNEDGSYTLHTSKNRVYHTNLVVSNLPVWNMEEITAGRVQEYFQAESKKYTRAWGAFTMGIVTDDRYEESMSLHHQLHISEKEANGAIDSGSIFVSMSEKGDTVRAQEGRRVLNVSAHTETDFWFELNGKYDDVKNNTEESVLKLLKEKLPGFAEAEIYLSFSATPVSWNNWVYRKKGRVGGIPQSMTRSLLDWTPNQTPFNGLYLCGDTVYPGQGIPGVTLSGFNVYYRVKRKINERAIIL